MDSIDKLINYRCREILNNDVWDPVSDTVCEPSKYPVSGSVWNLTHPVWIYASCILQLEQHMISFKSKREYTGKLIDEVVRDPLYDTVDSQIQVHHVHRRGVNEVWEPVNASWRSIGPVINLKLQDYDFDK